jgi:hypothetical protein
VRAGGTERDGCALDAGERAETEVEGEVGVCGDEAGGVGDAGGGGETVAVLVDLDGEEIGALAEEVAWEREGDDLAFVAFGDEGVGRGGESDRGGSERETVAGDFGAVEVDGAAVIDLEVEAELSLEICGGGGEGAAEVGGAGVDCVFGDTGDGGP